MSARKRRAARRTEAAQQRNADRRRWKNQERAGRGLPPLTEKQSKIKNDDGDKP